MNDSIARRGPVLTTKQAAEYVGLKPQTLRVMKCEGAGPKSFKQGRLNVYYPVDLDVWLAERLVMG
ncbi:putative DNA-binding transcriptional regulator AlpA [Microbacterium foliorum]|uniref:helix-turn-helix domain-containing protein n=1 Tax=Microbacterium foliorum TaxID=104336 RepID=UPI00209EF0DA|nr:helix-turn-helix domain-containing protein [Microbacterium foliorum]MCP1427533.1 putative DNA-binding transcriptional regulator AlpA [Microbacterium foliorum]